MNQLVRYIEAYAHIGRIGVLVEFRLETEVTTKCAPFLQLARDVALHITALQPATLTDLLQQPFVKDSAVTIEQLLSNVSAALREPISIARFVRWDTEPVAPDFTDPPKAPANVVRLGGSRRA